ncbi:hypothetical protein IMCC3317_03060 [Kordia antarctica]|uniref:Uncharacterized protein n=1 Tax=Kordia antarctica TaxID=1218801 RepID=A0A7L4ZEM6_9FLAO|nr:hypothetical protein [Kordia antarctica]QHI34960.1 hypothetical protein IMCC3317_03060 [Kordia antarctica]
MSVKDFFTAVIKIFAIYILIEGIIPLVSSLIYYNEIRDFSFILGFIGIILVFIAIIYFMLSQTAKIVHFLRLDKGFETERFDFSNVESNYILEIAITIMGFYMLFFTIPFILMDGYTLLKGNVNSHSFNFKSPELLYENILTNLLYILVGIIIILLRKPIANIFTSKS